MRLLLTGAAGFIGSHCTEHFLRNTDWHIVATDSFRHKGKTDRIADVLDHGPAGWRSRVTVVTHDLAAPVSYQMAQRFGTVDYVIAMASGSSVDRSLEEPEGFILNNTQVILSTLEYCRYARPKSVIVISTDEVYGPVEAGSAGHREWAPILPSNPYSSSKACQEAVAVAYWRSYGLPVIIVNCMNLIGERQDPEKYLPMLIRKISRGEEVTVHGVPGDIGSRYYLHARNLADALLFLLREPPAMFPAATRPDRYNVVGPDRVSNLALAQMVADILGRKLRYQLTDFHSARPGHDPHYGLDGSKLHALGWKPPVQLADGLRHTVRWTLANPDWLES